MSLKALSDYTFYSRYAQYLPEEKRRETWDEAVSRVFDMHRNKYKKQLLENPTLKEEVAFAEQQVRKKRVLGAQRALQYGGDPILKRNERIYNCSSLLIDKPFSFQQVVWLLLAGCGVGFSVQTHHIAKLPKLKRKNPDAETKTFVIPDTCEGWADSVGVLLASYFEDGGDFPEYQGKNVEFDFSEIRPKGALISGQFKAPGPKPLENGLNKIKDLIEAQFGEENSITIEPIVAYDILMHSSDFVISGGLRRSATICLFSPEDKQMMTAKTGNWFTENPQRGRSNNSVVLQRDKTDYDEFKEIFESIKQDGEPGFYFCNDDYASTTNPCVEIGFWPVLPNGESGVNFCVAGDTKLITREGIGEIEDLVGKNVEIWNGEEWAEVTPFKTGENKTLYRVEFSDGSYLDATDNHRFLAKNRFDKTYKEYDTLELIKELEESKYALSVPRSNIKYDSTGTYEEYAYEYGYVLGDGTVTTRGYPRTSFYNTFDFSLDLRGRLNENIKTNSYGTEYQDFVFENLDIEFSKELKYDSGLPSRVFSWSRDTILKFVAGWIDADGCVASKGVRIYGAEDKIRDGQLLLTKCGIDSSVNLMAKKEERTNLGERKNDVWYLQITKTVDIPAKKIVFPNAEGAKFKGKGQVIKSITPLAGTHDSFCVTEPKLHQCVFNNVLTKQCNLTEINGKWCTSEENFLQACRASAIIGTLQAGYNDFPYLGKTTEEIVRHEALLGCSITGWMDNPDILFNEEILEKGATMIKEVNEKVAAMIGVNPAARTTCSKPAGSTSCVLKTASGIHPHHARRYIRKVQANKQEFPLQHFKRQNPIAVEESVWSANNTDEVISFLCEVPAGAITKNQVDAVELLGRVKKAQKHWVLSGNVPERSLHPEVTHNISNTITVRDDEWDDVCEFIYENREYYTGVSLLPASGDLDYAQAPFSTVLTPSELIREYGDASVFASGLIVDGLHAFDDNLWKACDTALGRGTTLEKTKECPEYPKKATHATIAEYHQKAIEFDAWHSKVDWVRRVIQFADRYFEGNVRRTTYCLKHVSLWKTWCDLNREYKDVDWTNVVEIDQAYVDADTLASQACAGQKGCDI